MTWLTNTYDPEKVEAREYVVCLIGETRNEAWEKMKEYPSDKRIGAAMADQGLFGG